MEIQKFSDFLLNEARTNKKDVVDELLDMFKNRPNVEMKGLANERGIYSLPGMKTYLSKYKSLIVDQAFTDIQNDKKIDLKLIRVKVAKWNESIPYWYIGLTEDQAKKLKEEYQEEEYKKNEKEITKKAESKKASDAASAAKVEVKKAASAAKRSAKKSAPVKKGAGVERKPGGSTRKRVTKSTKK